MSIDQGRIESAVAYPIVGTTGWRLMVDVALLGVESAVLKAFLRRGGAAISETWTYQLFNR
jgi:glucans biosynthesis protein